MTSLEAIWLRRERATTARSSAGVASSSRARPLQEIDDLAVAALSRMGQWRHAFAVGTAGVGTGGEAEAHDLHMTWIAIAQNNRVQQRRPAQAIDMINIGIGL
jgi:hypothetical protein